jgi:hypothetical protein
MSKHLQVVVDEQELADIEAAARRHAMSLSDWVRQALGIARPHEPGVPAAKKLAVIRAAVQHDFPTAEIDQMLAEIASGLPHANADADRLSVRSRAGDVVLRILDERPAGDRSDEPFVEGPMPGVIRDVARRAAPSRPARRASSGSSAPR